MMSKKQWLVLLSLLIIYLLLGALFYNEIETKDESEQRQIAKEERSEIEELLIKHYVPSIDDTQDDIFEKLTTYCGKPMKSNISDADDPPKWDFYHSLFFVITVVTTIGYGNLAPTTPFGRIAMIFYSLIGIPLSGICMVTLGDFFAKSASVHRFWALFSVTGYQIINTVIAFLTNNVLGQTTCFSNFEKIFTKIYRRWKTVNMAKDTTKLSLLAQVTLYLIPGMIFFIFIPSLIIMQFEDWTYDVAVYYAFVTITTIGFGDYVAGVNLPETETWEYTIYRWYLIVWIISGLGYGLMVLTFITRGMRSRRLHQLEHNLSLGLKNTPYKIRKELQALVRENLLIKINKAYKSEFVYVPTRIDRSRSCPDLAICTDPQKSSEMLRKRAQSACAQFEELSCIQLNLGVADTERKLSQQSNLVLHVANALSNMDSESGSESESEDRTHKDSDDTEILASRWRSASRTLSQDLSNMIRRRSSTDIKFSLAENASKTPDSNWQDSTHKQQLQNIQEETACEKIPLPLTIKQKPSMFKRFKNIFSGTKLKYESDVEHQTNVSKFSRKNSESVDQYLRHTRSGRKSIVPPMEDRILEETSVAEFLRALHSIGSPETSSSSDHTSARPLIIAPVQSRRTSLVPATPASSRRHSLIPRHLTVNTDCLAPPPYASLVDEPDSSSSVKASSNTRRFSLRSAAHFSSAGPVQRQIMKTKERDELKEILTEKL